MDILTPEQISGERKKEADALERRIASLREEEGRAILSLNETKEDTEKEKGRLKLQRESALAETDQYIAEQKKRAKAAKDETDEIEKYRSGSLTILLQPIEAMREENQRNARINEERSLELDRKEKDVEEHREANEKKAEELQAREEAIAKVDERNNGKKIELDEQGKRLNEREEALNERERVFNLEIGIRESKVEARERACTDTQKGIEVRLEFVNRRNQELDERERLIKSRYEGLEAAIAEFEEKKQHG